MVNRRVKKEDSVGKAIVATSREQVMMMLLDALFEDDKSDRPVEFVRALQAMPRHPDQHVQEVRVVKLAIMLVEIGMRTLATSPLASELSNMILPVLQGAHAMHGEQTVSATELAISVLDMMEQALLEDVDMIETVEDDEGTKHERNVKNIVRDVRIMND